MKYVFPSRSLEGDLPSFPSYSLSSSLAVGTRFEAYAQDLYKAGSEQEPGRASEEGGLWSFWSCGFGALWGAPLSESLWLRFRAAGAGASLGRPALGALERV